MTKEYADRSSKMQNHQQTNWSIRQFLEHMRDNLQTRLQSSSVQCKDGLNKLGRNLDFRMEIIRIAGNKTCDTLEKKIESECKFVREEISELRQHMDERFSKVDERFSKMDEQFSKVDERFSKIDERFSKIDERFSKVDEKISELRQNMDERFLKVDEKFISVNEKLDELLRRSALDK